MSVIRLNNGSESENQLISVRFLFCRRFDEFISRICEVVVEEDLL